MLCPAAGFGLDRRSMRLARDAAPRAGPARPGRLQPPADTPVDAYTAFHKARAEGRLQEGLCRRCPRAPSDALTARAQALKDSLGRHDEAGAAMTCCFTNSLRPRMLRKLRWSARRETWRPCACSLRGSHARSGWCANPRDGRLTYQILSSHEPCAPPRHGYQVAYDRERSGRPRRVAPRSRSHPAPAATTPGTVSPAGPDTEPYSDARPPVAPTPSLPRPALRRPRPAPRPPAGAPAPAPRPTAGAPVTPSAPAERGAHGPPRLRTRQLRAPPAPAPTCDGAADDGFPAPSPRPRPMGSGPRPSGGPGGPRGPGGFGSRPRADVRLRDGARGLRPRPSRSWRWRRRSTCPRASPRASWKGR